jgi:hypothetical protein
MKKLERVTPRSRTGTFRSAAIDGNDGRIIVVERGPIAARAARRRTVPGEGALKSASEGRCVFRLGIAGSFAIGLPRRFIDLG